MSEPRKPTDLSALRSLLNALSDGTLDADGRAALGGMLSADPVGRRYYFEHMSLHAAMSVRMGPARPRLLMPAVLAATPSALVESREQATPAAGPVGRIARSRWLVAASLAAVVGVAAWMPSILAAWRGEQGPPPQTPVATVIDAVGVQWASDPHAPGDEVRSGPLRMESGRVELLMHSGVAVTLIGPVDASMRSAERMHLASGRLHADVPHTALGFTVDGPGFSVIDLGTEFVVDVPSSGGGPARIGVLVGSVELRTATDRMILTAAQTGAVEHGVARLVDRAPPPAVFVDTPHVRWQRAIDKLRTEPAMVHYAAMDGIGNADGRFAGDKAYRPDGSLHRVDDPATPHEAITLGAWVKLDTVGVGLAALLISERDEPGRVHWQIQPGGWMTLGTDAASGARAHRATAALSADRAKRWVLLAVVADPGEQRVRFYVDGEPVGDHPMADGERFKAADAVIGDSERWPGRRINGCIDDLFVLGRAMSDSDMKALFKAGRPPESNGKETR